MIKGRIKQMPRSDWVLGYTHRSPVNSQRSDQSGHDTRIWIEAPPAFFSPSPLFFRLLHLGDFSSMPSLASSTSQATSLTVLTWRLVNNTYVLKDYIDDGDNCYSPGLSSPAPTRSRRAQTGQSARLTET